MTIHDFLQSQEALHISYEVFEANVERFIAEMEDGLSGRGGSLKMLPTYLNPERFERAATRVITIDAGGTNLRIALVSFDEAGAVTTEYREVYPMPGTNGEVTYDEMFDSIAEYLAPIADKSEKIGFCFSFPCDMQASLDGRILHFTKEVKVTGASGRLIGEGLRDALGRRGLPSHHSIALLNDSVATLLGGKVYDVNRQYGGYIGFILGTGTNCCYSEQNRFITKDAYLAVSPGECLINMESGGYSKAPRTPIDEKFDCETLTPGAQLFEKTISGEYQGKLMLNYIREAADSGCFSPDFRDGLTEFDTLSGKEIDEFCYYPYGGGGLACLTGTDEADKQALYLLMDRFYERAAILCAMNLAAIMKKTNIGKNPLKPVCISAEGSTFYKSKLFHKKISYYMTAFAEERMQLYSEFIRVENATILGTAIAALLM